ncbi:MAG: hypothetical protein QN229_04925 [Desulfurococcaceae archaeon TW002]
MRNQVLILAYLMFLCVIASYVVMIPAIHAQTQAFDRLLAISNNDLILTYNVTRSVEISNVSGIPMSYSVKQEYVFRIKAINKTHIFIQGFRFTDSGIYLTLSSSNWVGIGGLTYWILSNYTDFLAKNVLPEYNTTIDRSIAIDFMNSMFVLPVLRGETSDTCTKVPIANAYINGFAVVVSTSLGSGNAYYDCKYGILFKAYITKTTYRDSGNNTYLIRDSISLELNRANTEILNEIMVSGQTWSLYGILLTYIIPAISIVVAITTVFIYILRVRRKPSVSDQLVSR